MDNLRDLLTIDYWREHRLGLAYAIFAAVLFVVFMIASFPYARALSVALVPIHLRVSYAGQRPAFPIGAVLEDVRLLDTRQPGRPPLFQSEQLALGPALSTVIGRPALSVTAQAYGGRAALALRKESRLTGFSFDLENINLARYPLPRDARVKVAGIASARGSLEIDPLGVSQAGSMNLDIRELALSLGRAMPQISFHNLSGKFQVNRGTLRIDRLAGTGPDMTIEITGTVHLMPTAAQTTVDLTASIRPTAAGRTHLGLLLNFLPHPPDNRPYHIRGPLTAPALT